MRILVAGTYGERNGIETYTRHLVSGLGAAGHDVFLADRSPEEAEETAGAQVVRLPRRSWPLWRAIGPLEARRARGALEDAIGRIRPDIVHLTYPELSPRSEAPAVMTAWHFMTGIIRRARTSAERGESRGLGALHGAADRAALRRAAAVVATSPIVERALSDGSRRVVRIPPFLPDAMIRTPQGERSRACLMVAGSLDDRRKGLDLAIATVRLMRESDESIRLTLVGGWSDPRRASRLPDFCDALGPMPSGALAAVMNRAGCVLVPSVFEEFGYVGLEALAAGTPVACAPLPGFEGLSTDGLRVAARRDAFELAAAASSALDLEGFEYPDACRASVAIEQIERLYHAISR
jgi:glycosyltransferase involved in cell wall biosynthesis